MQKTSSDWNPPRAIVFLNLAWDEAIASLRPCQLNSRKAGAWRTAALRLGRRCRCRGGPGGGSRRRLGRLAGRIAEIPEEVRIRPQQETGIGALQPVLISRHRTVEGEEVRILAIGLGKQAVALGIALAAGLLALGIGLGHDHRRLAI